MSQYEFVNSSKDKCSGCGLCAIKCPKNAIKMDTDDNGFVYARIDKSKCINCNICKKICPYINKETTNSFNKKSYVAVSNNDILLSTVASGGVFTSLAQTFIESGGLVCGSILNNNNGKFEVKHILCSSIKDLELIKGSKYVQSSIFDVYKEIYEALKKNKNVLFSGTPCQVASIKKYTGNPDNLYTIDIICHGVPSIKLFNDYIKFENNQKNIIIKDYKFRDKRKGWGLYYYYYYYDNKTKKMVSKTKPAFKSSYYQLFLDSYTYRDNCYSCPFATNERVGDITIGDYWGVEKEHPEIIKTKEVEAYKGISCLIVNSTKGEKLINDYGNNLKLFESTFSKIAIHNQQLNHPCQKKKEREQLLKQYKNDGYKTIDSFYRKKYIKKNIIKSMWYKIPYKLRKIIKK